MIWIGVDPGATGAIAIIDQDGKCLHVMDAPWDETGWLERKDQVLLNYRDEISSVTVEDVHAMPKQGVTSMFKFGVSFGMARLWAHLFAVPVYFVTPQRWQKAVLDSHGATTGDRKTRSLLFARRRWPEANLALKRHHGRADALCIAEWGRQGFGGRRGSAVGKNRTEEKEIA